MAKAKAANKVDIESLLRAGNEESAKAKKSEIPSITNQEKLADDANELLREYAELEQQVQAVKAKLHEVVFPEYTERAKADNFTKSLNLDGSSTQGVQVTYTDRFSEIDIKHEVQIQKACNFDQFFERKVSLKLKEQTVESVKDLVALIGPAKFAELFETKYVISCLGDMDRKQFGLPGQVRELLKQAAPSIKVRK